MTRYESAKAREEERKRGREGEMGVKNFKAN
jgi:hypothetical protein